MTITLYKEMKELYSMKLIKRNNEECLFKIYARKAFFRLDFPQLGQRNDFKNGTLKRCEQNEANFMQF